VVVQELARREERLRVIEQISGALGDTVELADVLRVSCRTLVGGTADLAVLALAEDGRIRLEVAHADPERQEAARRLIAEALGPLGRLASLAIEAGHTFRWLPVVTPSSLASACGGEPEAGRLVEALEASSVMAVALQSGDRAIGALALARTGGERSFTATDLAVAQLVARRIVVAVETARLRATMDDAMRSRSRLERALRKWTRVFDVASWGAAIVDRGGLRIDAVNPAFARMHGYGAAEELAGRGFDELLPPERVGEPLEWGTSPDRRTSTYESVHLREDGRSFPVLVTATSSDADPEGESFVVTVQDMTDLKRAEERLRRAQRMEAVGRLAGGVAHEVNNMMTIILGFSDLLGRAPELPESLQGDVDEIRKAAARAGKITQQLLAFSRQQVLQPADLKLNTIVEELVPVLRLLLPANVRVETRLSPVDVSVRADRAQLEQVLINLAFNARDAMAEGGTILISVGSRYLSEDAGQRLIGVAFPPGQYALVTVVDTGHGMDDETLEQLFEPFFTTKPAGLGTGLGLATVYGIVKQSGGYVWAESTPGEGTTFTVGLPLVMGVRRATAADETAEVEAAPEPGGTVLVVEDEEGVRQLAGRILEARGYRVLEARNGEEALSVLDQAAEPVDLVLTDVVVPDLGTGDLARRVREARDVPILYMSGYPREDVLERRLITADQPFLQKPFTGDELAEQVGRILRNDAPVVEG
jgi:two-component system cell cycle sensor histidine kinase/response regulator CckA